MTPRRHKGGGESGGNQTPREKLRDNQDFTPSFRAMESRLGLPEGALESIRWVDPEVIEVRIAGGSVSVGLTALRSQWRLAKHLKADGFKVEEGDHPSVIERYGDPAWFRAVRPILEALEKTRPTWGNPWAEHLRDLQAEWMEEIREEGAGHE